MQYKTYKVIQKLLESLYNKFYFLVRRSSDSSLNQGFTSPQA